MVTSLTLFPATGPGIEEPANQLQRFLTRPDSRLELRILHGGQHPAEGRPGRYPAAIKSCPEISGSGFSSAVERPASFSRQKS